MTLARWGRGDKEHLHMTAESEMGGREPARPVIDDEMLDRLMAQVDEEGLELLGPDGVLTELTSRIMNRGPRGRDGGSSRL